MALSEGAASGETLDTAPAETHFDDYPDAAIVERYRGRVLDTQAIMALLPHRPPMLLVDRIIELEPAERAVGLKAVTIGEPFFQGHFPNYPVMPGVLILEALAQVSGIAVMTALVPGRRLAFFTGVREAKFRRQVRPGDLLRLEATADRVTQRFGRLVTRMSQVARVEDQVVAEATSQFVLMEPEAPEAPEADVDRAG